MVVMCDACFAPAIFFYLKFQRVLSRLHKASPILGDTCHPLVPCFLHITVEIHNNKRACAEGVSELLLLYVYPFTFLLHVYVITSFDTRMRNQSEICPCLALFLLVVVLLGANVNDGAAVSSASCFSPKRLGQWIQQKCGKDGSAVWVYEGALYDPLDGHKIANVEGLELVRRLADSSSSDDDESSWAKRTNQLKAFNMTREADYSATLLTRRLFCYQSPQQPRRLLDSIRLRPNAPLRKIPVHQAVAVYDSATTYVSRDDKLLVHTEWPNGKCTWGIAVPFSNKKNKHGDHDHDYHSFDFNVFSKPNHLRDDVPDIVSTISTRDSTGTTDIVAAPKRSQWIQFGTSSKQQQPPPPEQVSMKYTRYGEAPPWYGAGKYCMLELQGRKVASVEEAPPLAASIAAERVPGFLSVNAPILSDGSAQRAMEWFRQGHLQLSEDNIENQEQEIPNGGGGGAGLARRLAFHVKKTSAHVLKKVRAASTLEQSSANTM